MLSVQPAWMAELPIQQQSVLFLASRGPDGIPKTHPCKDVQRAYRACVFLAAKYGRELKWGEDSIGDDFMDLSVFANEVRWPMVVDEFFRTIDELPHHYIMHLMHGAQILGYRHPDRRIRNRWQTFYFDCVHNMHLHPETLWEMDERLNDWGRKSWNG